MEPSRKSRRSPLQPAAALVASPSERKAFSRILMHSSPMTSASSSAQPVPRAGTKRAAGAVDGGSRHSVHLNQLWTF